MDLLILYSVYVDSGSQLIQNRNSHNVLRLETRAEKIVMGFIAFFQSENLCPSNKRI